MAVLARVGNVPDYQDIEIKQNADFIFPFQLFESNGTTPFNITGYTIAAQLRRTKLGALVVAFAVTVENAAQGTFYLKLTAAQTAALRCGESMQHSASRYWWDVRVQAPSPDLQAAYAREGEAFVDAAITRP